MNKIIIYFICWTVINIQQYHPFEPNIAESKKYHPLEPNIAESRKFQLLLLSYADYYK